MVKTVSKAVIAIRKRFITKTSKLVRKASQRWTHRLRILLRDTSDFIICLRPRTFNHKTIYKMRKDRRPILKTFAEKVSCREYLRTLLPEKYFLTWIQLAKSSREIDWDNLPQQFVVKVSHGCGGVIVVNNYVDPSVTLPTNPHAIGWNRFAINSQSFDRNLAGSLLDYWMTLNYPEDPAARFEWAYENIDRHIIVEEFVDSGTITPDEVKIFCINAKPELFSYFSSADLFSNTAVMRRLPSEQSDMRDALNISLENWDEIVEYSALISRRTDMARIDWMIGQDGPKIGEITSYPGAGTVHFRNLPQMDANRADRYLGKIWGKPGPYSC